MNPEEYQTKCLKTESADYERIKLRIGTRRNVRLLHGVMGLETEVSELQDALKKYFFYGNEIDEVNLKEELGDCLWYISLLCSELKTTFSEIMELNINKLAKRYGIEFNEEGAISRDLEAERYVLENNWTETCFICHEPVNNEGTYINAEAMRIYHIRCWHDERDAILNK